MKSDFPNEIDLGREINDTPALTANEAKPAKARKSYPTVYLSGIEGLRDLPKDGVALIYFHRNKIGIVDRENESMDSPYGGANGDEAEIEIRKLCLPDKGGDGDDKDTASAFKKFAKEHGVADAAPDNEDAEDYDEGEK